MQRDKKPVEKRRIGPAMQWAKPRNEIDRAQERKRNRISIDFNLDADGQTAQSESTSTSRDHSSEKIDIGSRTNQKLPNTPNNSETYGLGRTPYQGQTTQPRFNDDVTSGTAWDYYSGSTNEGQHADLNTGGSLSSQNYPHFNDVVSEYSHQVESPNYNARSTDFTTAQDNRTDQPGLRQLLLPILVVGIIIVVGVLSSLG